MDDSLVTLLNGSVMVQNLDLCIEVLAHQRVVRVDTVRHNFLRINQASALADLRLLDALFRSHVDGDTAHLGSLIDRHSVLVHTLDSDWLEVAASVGTDHELLVHLDCALEDDSTQDQTADVLYLELGINDEVGGDRGDLWGLSEVRLGQHAEELPQGLHTLTGQAGDSKDRAYLSVADCVLDLVNIVGGSDDLGDLLAVDLQDLCDLLKIGLEHFLRSEISLGEDDKDRYSESVGNTNVLFGHLGAAHVCTDGQYAVVGVLAGETMHSCLQVLLVATQVGELYNLRRIGDDIGPDLVLLGRMGESCNILLTVGLETHDLMSYGTGPSIIFLMLEVKDVLPHESSAVIDSARGR